MKIKFQSFFGGRVGGALPQYRDHHIAGGRAQAVETTNLHKTKSNLKHVGLDTPLKKHSGLLEQRSSL